jgi:gamma-glutamyltranspeptidase/glutathione hydrolase
MDLQHSSGPCAARTRLAHSLQCVRSAGGGAGSAVPGEGIDLIGGGATKFETAAGPLGSRTGSAALRVSLGAPNGLVTSASPLASMAGTRVLLAGGNAFDAAVAVAATLNVVEPMSSSIAGNGFSTVFDAATGGVHSLSMAGAAPLAVVSDELAEQELSMGYRAACTPGNLGGYLALIERFGTASLAETLRYAIEYAEGHPMSEALAAAIAASAAVLRRWPTSAALFLPGDRPPAVGEMWANPGLARTLKRLVAAERQAVARGGTREEGIRAAYDCFYTGAVAREITDFSAATGGLLSLADLAAYAPGWQEPIHTTYRGYDVYSNPSTTRGGLEVLMGLNLVEAWDVGAMAGPNAPEVLHLQAEAIKVSKACIYEHVGDPKHKAVPYAGLLSKQYAAHRRALIDEAAAGLTAVPGDPHAFGAPSGAPAASPAAGVGAGGRRQRSETYYDSPDTTSFSVLDATGNAVCAEPSLSSAPFGRIVVLEAEAPNMLAIPV